MGNIKFNQTNKNISGIKETAIEDTAVINAAEEAVIDRHIQATEADSTNRVRDDYTNSRKNLLFEDVTKRSLNGKQYVGNDGTVTAVFKGKAVHYIDLADNKLKDVDNSLIATADGFETKANSFKTRFKKNSANGEIFEITKNNCKVGLISKEAAAKGGCCLENCDCGIRHDQSEVMLKEVADNVDIQYIVDAGRVKENIIIKNKADNYEYNFDVNIENLTVGVLSDEKTLELKDKETGEAQFFIPGPFMVDANGAYSEAVHYEIETQNENTLSLKVVADKSWMNAADRAFPVTIDPQIVSSGTDLFEIKTYSRNIGSGSTGGWTESNHSDGHVGNFEGKEYKASLTIKKSLFDFPVNITKATLSFPVSKKGIAILAVITHMFRIWIPSILPVPFRALVTL